MSSVKKFGDIKGNIGTMPEDDFWSLHDVIIREAARRKVLNSNAWKSKGNTYQVISRNKCYIKYPVGAAQVTPISSSWDVSVIMVLNA